MRDWLKGLGRMRAALEGNRTLRPVAHWLRSPAIWHVSRRSVSRGVALGLFCSFLVPVGQIFLAAVLAVFLRANLIVASVSTLAVNPLTLTPVYLLAWRTGRAILGPAAEIREALEDEPVAGSFLSGLSDASLHTAAGLGIFAVGSAVLGYLLVHLVWWVTTRVKLRQRQARQRRAAQGEI